MKLSKFKEVVTRLVELERDRSSYFDSCPADMRPVLVENAYNNASGMQLDILLLALFGSVLVEEVYWILFDWQERSGYTVALDGQHYIIDTLDDFFAYIERGYGLVD